MNLEEILTWLKKRKDCKLGQGATEQEIEEAATSLGVRFPEEYAEFLRRVGWLEWAYDCGHRCVLLLVNEPGCLWQCVNCATHNS